MRRFILIAVLLISLPAMAELTVKDAVSREYLENHGYSPTTATAVEKAIAVVNGEAYEEPVEEEYYNQPFVKQVRRFLMYIDPSLDDHSFWNNHKFRTSPRYDDL